MSKIYHALGLHMHQPPDNLKLLIETNEWEARQIILCYERPLRYALHYKDHAYLHIGFSGILLEQFTDPSIVERYRHILDIPQMLQAYREADNIELVGMGYFHPIFPLIPKEDWQSQLLRGKEIIKEVFGKEPRGFWPSEMAFCREMIPALSRCGYEYVVVDSVHVQSPHPRSREAIIYQPLRAFHEDHEITIVPRDRDLSNAQESGMDAEWFVKEAAHKTASAPSPCLVTTWSDGENGGWFRQLHEESGFWGHYFSPYMDKVIEHRTTFAPVMISEYLARNTPKETVEVHTGAWNVGSTSGYDFSQWEGSETQKSAMREVWNLSTFYHNLKSKSLEAQTVQNPAVQSLLEHAEDLLLRAETSCHFFWGEEWLPKVYDNTNHARHFLKQAESLLN